MKKSSKKRIALYAIVAVILIAAIYLINNSITGNAITSTNTGYDFSRAKNPDYYSLLPPVPFDFSQIKLMWQQGIIRDDPDRINASYWKQPEWFPLYSENFVGTLNFIAETNRQPIWSLGIFDSQIYRAINQEWLQNATEIPEKTSGYGIVEIKNDNIIVKHRFWIRAAPGAAKIYGVGIYTSYPPTAYFEGNAAFGLPNQTIEQDPKIVEKYIKVNAVEHETGQTEFNLGAYWPKLDPEYVKQIEVTAEIEKDIPKGFYVVSVDASAPSREYQEQQSLKYLLSYTDPTIGMYRGPSNFRLFIEII